MSSTARVNFPTQCSFFLGIITIGHGLIRARIWGVGGLLHFGVPWNHLLFGGAGGALLLKTIPHFGMIHECRGVIRGESSYFPIWDIYIYYTYFPITMRWKRNDICQLIRLVCEIRATQRHLSFFDSHWDLGGNNPIICYQLIPLSFYDILMALEWLFELWLPLLADWLCEVFMEPWGKITEKKHI